MSEALVDISYRGLSLGRRVKLTKVEAASGYLETPVPMPVGTAIAIATDEGVTVEAIVTHVHEQVSSSGATTTPTIPGMAIRPTLVATDAAAWWSARLAGIAHEPTVFAPPPAPPTDGVTVIAPPPTPPEPA